MAAHSITPTWRIPWTEAPGGLQSMGWQRAGHDWAHYNTYITTEHHCLGGLNNNHLFLTFLEAGKSKIKVPARWVSGEKLLPCLKAVAPFVCVHRVERERGESLVSFFWVKKQSFSLSVMSDSLQPHGLELARLLCSWDSPYKYTGMGSHSLLQGIFPTQESNPALPHCRQILCLLSHKGSPRILEWIAYLFSRGSSQPTSQTGVSCTEDKFFTSWATKEALIHSKYQ